MSYVSVPYLEATPTITALRETPEAFEFKGDWVRHIPSNHEFKFDEGAGSVQLRAACSCTHLQIRDWQQRELADAFKLWRDEYWRPLLINREFASHFAARSPWRKALVNFTAWLHQLALRPETTTQPEHAGQPVSA
jgi:hypothetical protein